MAFFQSFHSLLTANLHLVNTTNIALIPKKDDANKVADYRPIHKVAKWISKTLALRLAPHFARRLYKSKILTLF